MFICAPTSSNKLITTLSQTNALSRQLTTNKENSFKQNKITISKSTLSLTNCICLKRIDKMASNIKQTGNCFVYTMNIYSAVSSINHAFITNEHIVNIIVADENHISMDYERSTYPYF